jgi:hypothetical protein
MLSRKSTSMITLQANPVQNNVYFNLNTIVLNEAKLEIYTIAGVPVLTENFTGNQAQNGVNVSILPAGVYIFRIADQQHLLGKGRLVKNN